MPARANASEHTTMLEVRARTALEGRYHRPLTEEEWDCAKHHLLSLAKLLERTQPTARQQLALLAFLDHKG